MLGGGFALRQAKRTTWTCGSCRGEGGLGTVAAVDISMSSDPRGACRVSEMDRSEERTLGLPHDTPGGVARPGGWVVGSQQMPISRAGDCIMHESGLDRGARHLFGGHRRGGDRPLGDRQLHLTPGPGPASLRLRPAPPSWGPGENYSTSFVWQSIQFFSSPLFAILRFSPLQSS